MKQTNGELHTGKRLLPFPFRNPWKWKVLNRHCLWTLFQNTALQRSKKPRRPWNWTEHISFWSTLV